MRITYIKWTPIEEATLDKYAERLPFQLLVEKLHSVQRRHGLPIRDRGAIRNKLFRMGWTSRANDGYLTTHAIAEALGVDICRVRRWEKLIPALRIGKRVYFHLDTIKDLARNHPERLAGISEEGLNWLLRDPELVAQCLKAQSLSPPPRPVRCIETGRVYHSIYQAEKVLRLPQSSVRHAANKGYLAGGYHWEFVS